MTRSLALLICLLSTIAWAAPPPGTGMMAGGVGNDSHTNLLVYSGTLGAVVFTDRSQAGRAITTVGNVVSSNVQSKFEATSILFDGTNDVLTLLNDTEWKLTGDFSYDFWIYPTVDATNRYCIFYFNSINFKYSNTQLQFLMYDGATNFILLTAGAPTAGVWQHWAVQRKGTAARLYVNGVPVDTDATVASVNQDSALFRISGSAANSVFGYMQAIRYQEGYAPFPWGGFTPPNRGH